MPGEDADFIELEEPSGDLAELRSTVLFEDVRSESTLKGFLVGAELLLLLGSRGGDDFEAAEVSVKSS